MAMLTALTLGAVMACCVMAADEGTDRSTCGPLRVHPDNPRYFADAAGRAVCLAGFHTWNNLQDMGTSDPPTPFDYAAYLTVLEECNCNFMRMWRWESPKYRYPSDMYPSNKVYHYSAPQPWQRTGPGEAADGKPRFDLTRLDETYFARLRERVEQAAERGIYVSVMLFEGHCVQFAEEVWEFHPFAGANNVNGIEGDADGDGRGLEFYTLDVPEVTRLQEAYVRKVIDTVGDLDNVLYEICNEAGSYSTEWQYHMIRFVKECEAGKPAQHPVGMTFQYRGGSNADLFASPADWISPNPDGGYRDDPAAADGAKVILSDTDHLWGVGGNRAWIWQTVTQGMHPLFMDPYGEADTLFRGLKEDQLWDIRRNLGYALAMVEGMDLAAATPRGDLASTGYCLAEPGRAYLVYAPEGGEVTVDLSGMAGPARVKWVNPADGQTMDGESVPGGAARRFAAPFAGDAVLYVSM